MERTPQHDYGDAASVDAEAVGEPGQRRFRLLVSSGSASASISMEKEQLTGVGQWLGEVVARLDEERPTGEADESPLPFPTDFDLEFRSGQLTLGYVEERDRFAIQAFEIRSDPETDAPTFRCFLRRGQSRVLAKKIAQVVAAGRPTCQFCGEPIDPSGHGCPKANGHKNIPVAP